MNKRPSKKLEFAVYAAGMIRPPFGKEGPQPLEFHGQPTDINWQNHGGHSKAQIYNATQVLLPHFGQSFILNPKNKNLNQLFLKLPPDPKTIGVDYTKIESHFSEEIQNLLTINSLEEGEGLHVGRVAKVYGQATLHRNGQRIPAILEQYVSEASNLDIWLKRFKRSRWKEPKVLKLWLILAFALTNIVRRLHNHGIVHGSIRPAHILLGHSWELSPDDELNFEELMNDVHLVGFGTSAILFDPEQYELVQKKMKDERYAAPEVRKLGRVDGLLSYSADLYSIGAILFTLALNFGKDAKVALPAFDWPMTTDLPETVDALKSQISDMLHKSGWNTESIAKVVDKALRYNQKDRYLCAEEMLQFILNAADTEARGKLMSSLLPEGIVHQCLDKVNRIMKLAVSKISGSENQRLPQFLTDRMHETATWQALSAFNGHLEVYGSRDVLLDWLCAFMGLLKRGDSYFTRTIPAYWTDNNLGANGRMLVKNKDLAVNGVKVQRLFMVAHEFDELPISEQMALLQQRQACREVWAELDKSHDASGTYSKDNYEVRVMRVQKVHDLLQVERRMQFVAYATFSEPDEDQKEEAHESPPEPDKIGFSFMSQGRRYQEFNKDYLEVQLTKLRFHILKSNLGRPNPKVKFETDWDAAKPLDQYLNQGAPLELILSNGRDRNSKIN